MEKLSFSLHEIKWKIQESLFTFKENIDLSELSHEDSNDIRQIENVYVEGFFSEDGKDILCHFDIKSDIILPCARTLIDVPYHLEVRADEVFTESDIVEDDDVNVIESEVIDLIPYIREHLLLNVPYRVFADDAKIEGGKNWTYQLEDEAVQEKEDRIDPRLEKLQQLLNDDED